MLWRHNYRWPGFLMPSHPLTNLKYKSIIKINLNSIVFIQGIIYLKQNYGAYVINLDEYKSIETHWIAFYMNANNRRASCDAI